MQKFGTRRVRAIAWGLLKSIGAWRVGRAALAPTHGVCCFQWSSALRAARAPRRRQSRSQGGDQRQHGAVTQHRPPMRATGRLIVKESRPRRCGSTRNYLLTDGFSSADTFGVPAHQEPGVEARRTTAIKPQTPHRYCGFSVRLHFSWRLDGRAQVLPVHASGSRSSNPSSRRHFWTPGRRSFRTDRLEPSWPHRSPIAHPCASPRQH